MLPANRKLVPGELVELFNAQQGQVADQVKRRFTAWNDPRARLDRRYRRSSRALTVWAIILAVFSVLGVLAVVGAVPVAAGVVGALGATGGAVLAVRSGVKMRAIDAERTALANTAPPPRPPLPAKASAARYPMERLAEAEDALAELLVQLDSSRITSVPTESVEQARETGREAASAIRAVSQQLQAVERARDTAPPLQRAPLVEGVRKLRAQLDEGVDGYCGLVGAAGNVLAESAAADPSAVLDEATDHLAGLASGLRELSG
ncbi:MULTISPECIES: hypothetical protein [Actinosynnema]|uniref:phage shock envelope stress response protein PspM n=1 Tax=Actinosynnema TaxID=40566 RepID=UPI0020A48D19|nr:hypothetical protein [Actinosynnema pretiosum]MCP2094097.1 hypothetical protein [Actinosynnema pretiosum]